MRDVASGCVLVVVALAYFFEARGLPLGQGEPGPRFLPFLLAGALFVLGVSIAAQGWRESHRVEGALARPVGMIALTAVYALAMAPVGFVISTLVYGAGVTLLLGMRGWRVVAIPAATTAFIYAAFVLGLGVVLP